MLTPCTNGGLAACRLQKRQAWTAPQCCERSWQAMLSSLHTRSFKTATACNKLFTAFHCSGVERKFSFKRQHPCLHGLHSRNLPNFLASEVESRVVRSTNKGTTASVLLEPFPLPFTVALLILRLPYSFAV